MLTPDFVWQPRRALRDALAPVLPPEQLPRAVERALPSAPAQLPPDLKGVVVRIKEIRIFDNQRSGPVGGLFGGDRAADIYPIALVASGGSGKPVQFSLPTMFNGIHDHDVLPITAPGLAITRLLDTVPEFLDIHVLIMRSLEKTRDFAGAIDAALSSNEGKGIVAAVQTLFVSNPAAGVALNVAGGLLGLVLKYMKAEKDRQIFYGVGSFELSADALGIGGTHPFEDKRYARAVIEVVPA